GDGRVVSVSGRAVPMWIEGRPAGFVGTLADITERERLLAGERRARELAERATRQHDEMLGMVAHDLRTPLHAIMMSTATMLQVPLTDDQRAQVLAVMQRSAQSMERLIRDLLDVTRIELGKFVVEHMQLEVRSLLDATCELFEPEARKREISFTCEVSPGIPAVLGDRDRLMQVLSNLVGNALNLTPPSGHVSLRARPIDGHVLISVENTGPGIAPDNLPHLFDRFWQANRTSGDGAGLGLAIAKGIVEAHRGRIWAESVPGHGTTFYLTLPNPVVTAD
ncbi:MAG: sensor histidine kinase, partial [Steroidobacteraceae bacterium]